MRKNVEVIVVDSFKIAGRGVVVELKHKEKGLRKHLKLRSSESRKFWEIISRVLFNHTILGQRIFKNETTTLTRLRFNNFEDKQNSYNEILAREKDSVFQYLLQPIGHNDKPNTDEVLSF